MTTHNLAINNSLGTLLNVLQCLGVICIWSLSSFLMRFYPSTTRITQWGMNLMLWLVNYDYMLLSRRLHSILFRELTYTLGLAYIVWFCSAGNLEIEDFEIILLEAYQKGCCRILKQRFSALKTAKVVIISCCQFKVAFART